MVRKSNFLDKFEAEQRYRPTAQPDSDFERLVSAVARRLAASSSEALSIQKVDQPEELPLEQIELPG